MEVIGWYRDEQLDVNSDSQGLPAKYVPFRKMVAGSARPYGDGWKPLTDAQTSQAPEAAEAEALLDDLSTLVVRLAHALRKASPDNGLPVKAMEYLYRKDLAPSVLRGGAFGEFATIIPPASPDAGSEHDGLTDHEKGELRLIVAWAETQYVEFKSDLWNALATMRKVLAARHRSIP